MDNKDLLSEFYDASGTPRLTPIEPEVKSHCVVDGKPLEGFITNYEHNPIQPGWHVRFSDGYSSSFFPAYDEDDFFYMEQEDDDAPLADEKSVWVDAKQNTQYAEAIAEDLNAIYLFSPDKPFYCFILEVEGTTTNVWVRESEKDQYSVYYKGDFRFDVNRTQSSWTHTTVDRHESIDEKTANKLATALDALS